MSNYSTGILFDIIGAKSTGSDYFQHQWHYVCVLVCVGVYVVCGLSETNSICVAYFLGQC